MATISSGILARYAADAAHEVEGVNALVGSALHRHKGVRVVEGDGQRRVGAYLAHMASVSPQAVDVVVEEVGSP